ncbi:MAG: DUF1517 domain-containing protein [Cyanobacteria bacterium P01_A01_bin.105]
MTGESVRNFRSQLRSWAKPIFKSLVVLTLAFALVFSQAEGALAARAGGRIGGGSFRAPRSYSPPTRSYRSPSGYGRGGYYPGGGFGFPFMLPLFGFSGGGLFSLLIFFAIASFLVRTFRSVSESGEYEAATNPNVSVAKLQIGLLAQARNLQDDLNRLAKTADTGTTAGLTQVLQETTLSLLRHPEYWAYADAATESTRLTSAEQTFNRFALTERSKLAGETLSNVNQQLQQADAAALAKAQPDGELATMPGEYIVATVLVAAEGQVKFPKIHSEQDVRQALSQIGAVASDRLMAVEVLWTPQTSGETLSADELVAEYPNLKLV